MTTNDSDNSTAPRVAVLGLGTMGAAMATRLLAAGIAVDVWNRIPGPAMALVERGATAYAEPADAVSAADVVLTALPTEDAVRSVIDRGCLPHSELARCGRKWAPSARPPPTP